MLRADYQLGIYTRFNLPIHFQDALNRADIHLSNQWLNERIRLFKQFCLPSVELQTFQEFIWFVCFSEETPQKIIDQVCVIDQIVPILAASQTQAVERSLKHLKPEGALISTRLDSDDSIATSFLEMLAGTVDSVGADISGDNYVVSFTDGCEYDAKEQRFRRRLYLHNPFLGLCENVRLKTKMGGIFETAHHRMHRLYKTLLIPTKDPMWCINVHEGNVSNYLKGEVTDENFSKRFNWGQYN